MIAESITTAAGSVGLADGVRVLDLVNFTTSTSYFTLINTGLITLAYFFLLHKKVVKMLDKRKDGITEDISAAKSAKERAEKAEKDYIEKMADSKEEARRIIESAKKTAEKRADEIIAEANESARLVREKGQSDIEKEIKAAKNAIKDEIGTLVIAAAGAVIKREVSAANNADIIEDFLRQSEAG